MRIIAVITTSADAFRDWARLMPGVISHNRHVARGVDWSAFCIDSDPPPPWQGTITEIVILSSCGRHSSLMRVLNVLLPCMEGGGPMRVLPEDQAA
jgi:hypothetical protein